MKNAARQLYASAIMLPSTGPMSRAPPSLLLEYKQDFQKKEDGVDYGGSIYMVGMRFRW